MRLYPKDASSEARLRFGDEFAAGAEEVPETVGFVGVIEGVQAPLKAAHDARVEAEAPLPGLRAKRDIRELQADRSIASDKGRLEAFEQRKGGPIFQALFENGTLAVTAPRGQAQVDAAGKYRKCIVECGVPAFTDELRQELLDKLDEKIGRLAEAVGDVDDTEKQVAALRQVEEARRDDHLRTMDSLFGELRRLFPRDRAMQDAIAPKSRGRRRRKKPTDESGE